MCDKAAVRSAIPTRDDCSLGAFLTMLLIVFYI